MTLAPPAAPLPPAPPIVYPEGDGNPIADNTLQFQWIVTLQGGLDALFADRPDVFVAGDLLWYPVQGNNRLRVAPDVLVVFGRPKGYRGVYKQWEEGDTPPQVVFEVLSPGNRFGEMSNKLVFYDRYGVEEYVLYDPKSGEFTVWVRDPGTGHLEQADTSAGWASPRLGVRFDTSGPTLALYHPDGRPFQTFLELYAERDKERARAERLAEKLRALGVDPDAA